MNTMTEPRAKLSSQGILFDKKVVLMPVTREGGMITDKNHVGFFMYDGTKSEFVLPLRRYGGLLQILTQEEQEFFEERLRVDLSFSKKKDNYWHTFRVTITKDSNFLEKGHTLDLSDPIQNLQWRILKVNPAVAPSWEDRFEDGAYRFALTDPNHQDVAKSVKADRMKTIYRHFASIDAVSVKMYDFLSVYWMQVPKSRRPDPQSSSDVFKSMIQDIIDSDPNGYMRVIEDTNYETKLFLNRAMAAGYIDRSGVRGDYNIDGRYLGKNLDEAVSNILSSEFHADLLRVRALLDPDTKAVPPSTPAAKIKDSNDQSRGTAKI